MHGRFEELFRHARVDIVWKWTKERWWVLKGYVDWIMGVFASKHGGCADAR